MVTLVINFISRPLFKPTSGTKRLQCLSWSPNNGSCIWSSCSAPITYKMSKAPSLGQIKQNKTKCSAPLDFIQAILALLLVSGLCERSLGWFSDPMSRCLWAVHKLCDLRKQVNIFGNRFLCIFHLCDSGITFMKTDISQFYPKEFAAD